MLTSDVLNNTNEKASMLDEQEIFGPALEADVSDVENDEKATEKDFRKRERKRIRDERHSRTGLESFETSGSNFGLFGRKNTFYDHDGALYPAQLRGAYRLREFIKSNTCAIFTGCIIVMVIIIMCTYIFSGPKVKSDPIPVPEPMTETPLPPIQMIPPKYSNLPPRRAVTPPKTLPAILRPPVRK